MAEDYRWEHAKAVADRCAKRFSTRTEIERYLAAIGWEQSWIERMIKHLDRNSKPVTIDLPDNISGKIIEPQATTKKEIPEDWDI